MDRLMIRNLLSRAMPVTTFVAVVLVAVGAAMGGNLPFDIQQAVSETAGEIGIEVPSPSTTDPSEFRTGEPNSESMATRAVEVHTAIETFKVRLDAWTSCVAEAASLRGTGKTETSADDKRATGNPVDECGAKPRLDVPRPADDTLPTRNPQTGHGPQTTNSDNDGPGNGNRPDKPTTPTNPRSNNRP